MKFSSVKSVPAEVLLLKITCIAWLIAKLYSYKAWITDRNFPIIPTFDFFVVPSEIHTLLFVLSLICIFSLLLFPNKKTLILTLIFVEIFSCLLDQMRWQPWEYQYLITLILFVLIGYLAQLHPAYYVAVAITALCFVYQCKLTRERTREECFKAFLNNNYFGMGIFIALLLGIFL